MSYPKLLAPLFVSCCLLTSASYAGVHLGLPGKQQPQSFNDLMVLASPVDKDNSLLNLLNKEPLKFSQPDLELGGLVEAGTQFNSAPHHPMRVQLYSLELASLLSLSPLFHSYLSGNFNSVSDQFSLKTAMLMIGELKQSPFYGSIGQYYVPFGEYATSVVDAVQPLPVGLGAINATAATLGYQQAAHHGVLARAFIYDPRVKDQSSVGGGASVDERFSLGPVHVDVGTSVIDNISNSDAQYQLFNANSNPHDPIIPAMDARIYLHYRHLGLLSEFTSALTRDSSQQLLINNREPLLQALHVELNYAHQLFSVKNKMAIGFSDIHDGAAINLPNQRYYVVDNAILSPHISLALQCERDDYDSTDNIVQAGKLATQLKHGHQYMTTLQLGVYF